MRVDWGRMQPCKLHLLPYEESQWNRDSDFRSCYVFAHYENTPIQIHVYRKFPLEKLELFK